MGKSGSGKNTLKDALEKYGIIPLHECTTREKRPGEVNGEDYYFFSKEEFQKSDVICKSAYATAAGILYYGIVKEKVKDNQLYSVIINPCEYMELCLVYKTESEVIPIWIDTDDERRMIKTICREEQRDYPNYQELCRRLKADHIDFSEQNDNVQKILAKAIRIYNGYNIPMSEIASEVYNDSLRKREFIKEDRK